MHELLKHQLELAQSQDGASTDLPALLKLVDRSYRKLEAAVSTAEYKASGARPAPADENSYVQTVLDHVKDAILTVDRFGSVETFNPTGERMFGYTAADVVGKTLSKLIPPASDLPVHMFLDAMALRSDDTHTDLAAQETLGAHRDGSLFPVEIAVSEATIQGRSVYVVAMRDITERKEAERALRESEARNRALVESAPEAIVVLDVDQGRFVDANDNATELFKLPRETLLTIGPSKLSPEHQPDGSPSFGPVRGHISAALAGRNPVFEWTHLDANGRSFPCEVRFAALPSSSRRLVRASILDISARKRQELLIEGERQALESLASHAALSETLDSLCATYESLDAGARCAVLLLQEAGGPLEPGSARNMPAQFPEWVKGLEFEPAAGERWTRGKAGQARIRKIDAHGGCLPGLHEQAASAGLACGWCLPVMSARGTLLGLFMIFYPQEQEPVAENLEALDRLARLAGIAIDRLRAQEALLASEVRYRSLFENVVDGLYQTSVDGVLLSANPALVQMLGFESERELRAVNMGEMYVNPGERQVLFDTLQRDGVVRNYEFLLRRKDGEIIVVMENARAVRDANGKVVSYEGTLTDITDRKKAEMAVFEEKERAEVTLQSIADAVITTDAAGRVSYLNPAAEDLIGWELRAVRACPVDTVFRIVNRETGSPMENPLARCLREGRALGMSDEAVLLNRAGHEVAVHESASPIRDRDGRIIGAVMVFRDLSLDGRLRRQLSYQATHDDLTGLINRREFENRLEEAIRETRLDTSLSHVMLYMDLDQFKLVNDTCGHTAGDQLLKKLTAVLKAKVRSNDVLARLGGDEFGVLLQGCNLEKAMLVAEGLRQAVRDFRYTWERRAANVSISIGVVGLNAGTRDAAAVMSAADVACFAAKESGRNRVHVYEIDDERGEAGERHQEMLWVSRITSALEDERFVLYFQPIVPIGANRDKRGHFELLLRMLDEHGNVVTPDSFIPAAERYNLMPMLDRWVIRQTLSKLADRENPLHSGRGYTVAVNLSGTSLNDPAFLNDVVEELAAHKLPPGALCFEITETAAIANLGSVAHFMAQLKEQGCEFALDDFGSGLSSFAYLKNLPVDYLKIDGHFITNVVQNKVDRSMVDAITKVGDAMGIKTIAERVESREVLETLSDLGVHYAQGFFISRPESVEGFARFANAGGRPALQLA